MTKNGRKYVVKKKVRMEEEQKKLEDLIRVQDLTGIQQFVSCEKVVRSSCLLSAVNSPNGCSEAIFQCLLSRCEDVNPTTAQEKTPLFLICETLQLPLLKLLLKEEKQILQLLLKKSKKKQRLLPCLILILVVSISRNAVDVGLQMMTLLLEKAKELHVLQELLNETTPQQLTVLQVACLLGQERVVKFLLKEGADVTHCLRNSSSPVSILEKEYMRLFKKNKKAATPNTFKALFTKGHHYSALQKKLEENNPVGERTVDDYYDCLYAIIAVTGCSKVLSSEDHLYIHSHELRNRLIGTVGINHILDDMQSSTADHVSVLLSISSLYKAAYKSGGLSLKYWLAAKSVEKYPCKINPRCFKVVTDVLISFKTCCPRLIRSWSMLLPEALGINQADFSLDLLRSYLTVSFFNDLALATVENGKRVLFNIFDNEHPHVDEDWLFDTFLSCYEFFVRMYIPVLLRLKLASDDQYRQYVAVWSVFDDFWQLVSMSLKTLKEVTVYYPARFAVQFQAYVVNAQLRNLFFNTTKDQDNELRRLQLFFTEYFIPQVSSTNNKNKKGNNQKRKNLQPGNKRTMMVHPSVCQLAFPPPNFFSVHSSLGSLSLCLSLPEDTDLINWMSSFRLQNKVDYIQAVSEIYYHSGRFSLYINRMNDMHTLLEFIIQQVSSAKPHNLRGDFTVVFVDEPGLGNGPIREFFNMVRNEFFNPEFRPLPVLVNQTVSNNSQTDENNKNTPTVQILSNWIETARQEIQHNKKSQNQKKKVANTKLKQPPQDIRKLWPLFEYVNAEIGTMLRLSGPGKSKKQLCPVHQLIHYEELNEKQEILTRLEKNVYTSLGRFIGLALQLQQPLGVCLPLAFWQIMMKQQPRWYDYCEGDDEFRYSMQQILDYDFDQNDLELYFLYTTHISLPDSNDDMKQCTKLQKKSNNDGNYNQKFNKTLVDIELMENGSDTKVNNANKMEFVLLRSQAFFYNQQKAQLSLIQQGFLDVVLMKHLVIFQPQELQQIILGEIEIDVSDLKETVEYGKGLAADHHLIKDFWEVVSSLEKSSLENLLLFWSGTAKPPLFGFKHLHSEDESDQAWIVEHLPGDSNRCPLANTCDRRLLLPAYPSRKVLAEKLKIALDFGACGYDRM